MSNTLFIDVVYDAICPWCFIGKRRLERALTLRPGMGLRLRWWPFLLNPDLPGEGIDWQVYLVRKFGGTARVNRVLALIAEIGQSVGIDFAFERIGRAPNTVNAHRLIRFAAAEGCADAAVEAVFCQHFIDGSDIGSLTVLTAIGTRIGLDADSLRSYLLSNTDVAAIFAENARAHRCGITGVPSFVFNGVHVISGAHESSVLVRMLDVARETQARLTTLNFSI